MRSNHPKNVSDSADLVPRRPKKTDTGRADWGDLLAEGRFSRFILICLGVWLTAVDTLVTATIMPSVGLNLGGYAYFGWTIAGFMTGVVLACASAGRFSEIVGLRRATVLAGLVFGSGCLMSALAHNMEIFTIGRLVQGIGGGWISGFAMIAIALLFPERHLARVFAATAAIWGVATLLGPLIGGLFADAGNWRGVFWLFAFQALAFVFAAAGLLGGIAPPTIREGIPWRQLAILALGIGFIGAANIIGSTLTAILFVILGLTLIACVLRVDATAQIRLLPRGASDVTKACGAGYVAMFTLTAASIGLSAYGPAILQELRGLSPLAAGYAVAVMAFAWTGSAFAVAGSDRSNERGWIRAGSACILVGAVLLALVMGQAHLALVLPSAAIMGVGFGLSSSLMNRRVLGGLSDEDRAIGSSALIASRQAGGAVGAAIAGVAANFAGFASGLNAATASTTALWVFTSLVPLAAVGTWAAWRLTRSQQKATDA
ncbi:arabinose efflux permease family protein [Puniceibacterium sp. IMCC21224]|nr:arabinose efflux permease family protein [Puniceibacterium sp. IMCC21224]